MITNAQKLKDALYGGKLKTDSGTVIRKGDDLSTKIDTSTKKPVEQNKSKMTTQALDSSTTGVSAQADSASTPGIEVKENKVASKDNNKLWKEYVDSIVVELKAEALPSKKIKKGAYFVIVEYEIGIDGQTAITNVWPTPENEFIQQQVKERLNLTAPKLYPVLAGNGQPRKVIRKYTFTLTKE
jgi:hypothetical protein